MTEEELRDAQTRLIWTRNLVDVIRRYNPGQAVKDAIIAKINAEIAAVQAELGEIVIP